MLIVIAIIAILATMVIGIAARIDIQDKEKLAKATLALLDAALGQFEDFGYEYKLVVPNAPPRGPAEMAFYRSLHFPIDCNGLPYDPELRSEWTRALGFNRRTYLTIVPLASHDLNYSGCEVLYFFLNLVPQCRATLDKIDGKLITNLGTDGTAMKVTIGLAGDEKDYPLFRVIDPWGTTLRYDYYDYERYVSTSTYNNRIDTERTFPVITSAGPDKTFGNTDDIKSR
jgi:type II secretory pathway pseudopilin PulG